MKARALLPIEWGVLRRLAREDGASMHVHDFVEMFTESAEPELRYQVLWSLTVDGLIHVEPNGAIVFATNAGLGSWFELDVLGLNHRVAVSEHHV